MVFGAMAEGKFEVVVGCRCRLTAGTQQQLERKTATNNLTICW